MLYPSRSHDRCCSSRLHLRHKAPHAPRSPGMFPNDHVRKTSRMPYGALRSFTRGRPSLPVAKTAVGSPPLLLGEFVPHHASALLGSNSLLTRSPSPSRSPFGAWCRIPSVRGGQQLARHWFLVVLIRFPSELRSASLSSRGTCIASEPKMRQTPRHPIQPIRTLASHTRRPLKMRIRAPDQHSVDSTPCTGSERRAVCPWQGPPVCLRPCARRSRLVYVSPLPCVVLY